MWVRAPLAAQKRWLLDEFRPSNARLVPTVDVFHAPAGLVIVPPASEHRVCVHAGPPVRGVCGRQHFVNERGDVNLVPAGLSEQWYSEGANEWRVVTLPRALLTRAAQEIGRPHVSHLEARCQLRDPRIQHIVWALAAESEAGGQNGLLYAEALGLALAFHLLGRYEAPARPERGLSAAESRRVVNYVEAHLESQPVAPDTGRRGGHEHVAFQNAISSLDGLCRCTSTWCSAGSSAPNSYCYEPRSPQPKWLWRAALPTRAIWPAACDGCSALTRHNYARERRHRFVQAASAGSMPSTYAQIAAELCVWNAAPA